MLKMLGNEEVVEVLNHLIEVCQRSQTSYLDAVKSMPTLMHRATCAQYALQRENFTAHLSQQILCITGKALMEYHPPVTKRHCPQSASMRSLVQTNNEAAVLHECKTSEECAKTVYEEVLGMQHLLPPAMYTIIAQQYEKILKSHTEVLGWYRSCKPALSRVRAKDVNNPYYRLVQHDDHHHD